MTTASDFNARLQRWHRHRWCPFADNADTTDQLMKICPAQYDAELAEMPGYDVHSIRDDDDIHAPEWPTFMATTLPDTRASASTSS